MSSKKRVEWVFVFRTPTDLHAFIQIVENVISPEDTLVGREPKIESRRDDSLERKNIEYLERMGLAPEGAELASPQRAEQAVKPEKKKREEPGTSQDRVSQSLQVIKDKVFEQKLKEEALLLEEKKKREAKNELEMKAMLEQKDVLQFAWKINYQNHMLDYSRLASNPDDIAQNGLKLFKMISEFRSNAVTKVREIVDELCFPQNARKNLPTAKHFSEELHEDELEGAVPVKLVFRDDNYLVTVAIPEETEKVYLKDKGFSPFVVDEGAVGAAETAKGVATGVLGPGHDKRRDPRAGQPAE